MAQRGPELVRVDGLRELRSTLRKLDPVSARALTREIKAAAGPIVREAQAQAPRRTGRLAASIRATSSGNRLAVGSRLPQANVLHWGGTIRPRGVPITFPRTEFITRAAVRHRDEIPDAVGDAIERVWERG